MLRPSCIALTVALALSSPAAQAFHFHHHNRVVVVPSSSVVTSGVAFAPNTAFTTSQASFVPAGVSFAPTASFAPAVSSVGGCFGGTAGVSFVPVGVSSFGTAGVSSAGGCFGGTAGVSSFGSGPSAAFGPLDVIDIIRRLAPPAPQDPPSSGGSGVSRRLTQLEGKVDDLEIEVRRVARRLGQLETTPSKGADGKKKKPKRGDDDGAFLPDRPRGTFPAAVTATEAAAAGGDPKAMDQLRTRTRVALNIASARYYANAEALKRAKGTTAKGLQEENAVLRDFLAEHGRDPLMPPAK